MKAILEFSIPEEEKDFLIAQAGWRYKHALELLDDHLRSRLKHEDLDLVTAKVYQEVRDIMREYMHELPL